MPLKTKEAAVSARQIDECLLLIAQDDCNALDKLYQLTSSAVYAYALSVLKNVYDAQDVTHDVYVKVYDSAHNYQSYGKPMAWILTIAKNLCYTKFRQQAKFCDVDETELENQLANDDRISAEDRLVIVQMLKTLNDSERQIVVMHALSGLKHKDIAKTLDMPLATVLSKYNRALKKLQSVFQGEEQ